MSGSVEVDENRELINGSEIIVGRWRLQTMPKEVIEEVMRGDEERVQKSIRTNLSKNSCHE